MGRNHQLSVRIPQLLYVALKEQAERERRTVADVVNNMLEERYPSVLKGRVSRR